MQKIKKNSILPSKSKLIKLLKLKIKAITDKIVINDSE